MSAEIVPRRSACTDDVARPRVGLQFARRTAPDPAIFPASRIVIDDLRPSITAHTLEES